MAKKLILLLVVLLVIAQLVPYPPAENPPPGEEVPAPAEVRTILRTSCYDCHSNETVWPWYSNVIPTKWLVRNHVREGRGHLNFSSWEVYPPERAARKLEEVVEMVEGGEMPLQSYERMHPGAELTSEEAARLMDWARSLRESSGGGEAGERGTGEGDGG